MVAVPGAGGNGIGFGAAKRHILRHFPSLIVAPDERPPSRPSKSAIPRTSRGVPAPGDKVAEAYQDLLKEIVEKKKQEAAARRAPPRKKKSAVVKAVLAVVLPPIVAALWIFQPFADDPGDISRPPDKALAWQTTLMDAALTIREWRDSAGRFPDSAPLAGVNIPGLTFEIHNPEEFSLRVYSAEGLVTVWMKGELIGTGPRPLPPPPIVVDSAPPVFQ